MKLNPNAVIIARVNAKLTPEQLSQKTGVSLPTIRKIENGEGRTQTRTLLLIAKSLGVAPGSLILRRSEYDNR